MLLYSSSVFEKHDTRNHPECIARIVNVNQMLERSGWTQRCIKPTWAPATQEQLLKNHSSEYLAELRRWCDHGAGRIEVDTVVSKGSWDAALMAAGAVCDAVERVLPADSSNEERIAFCAIRPPGHHCMPKSAMGFCLLNNVSVGALHARKLGAERVLIIDWDIHHGNGTQASFWEVPTVGFVSIHRFPFYPGTGNANETGTGDAIGTKVNIPVSASTGPTEFLDKLKGEAERLAAKTKPDLIILSAGFDAHRFDPVGGLSLEEEHFEEAGKWASHLAREYTGGRIVSVLEGGYHLEHMPASVDAHLRGLTSQAN